MKPDLIVKSNKKSNINALEYQKNLENEAFCFENTYLVSLSRFTFQPLYFVTFLPSAQSFSRQ